MENLPCKDPTAKALLVQIFSNPVTKPWRMKRNYITLLLVACAFASFGQIAVTQSSNSQTLSQLLAGSGVTISNYSMSCASNGSGTFTNTNTNLGMPGGVMLASGKVSSVPNGANVFASTQFTATGDAQLSTLTNGTIYDPCILQFDIVPQGPLLKFDYVFASEEYPEWVCSQFNDVFGFFITGPNPGGGNYTNKNMALITGTNLPVAINTVNPGNPGANSQGGTCNGTNQTLSYSSIYTNNQTPLNTSIVYDGMTHLLTATAAVTPCQTYHLKIAIADVADRIYDSGVFLSAYSFNSNPVSVSAVGNLDYAGFSSAYEGCVGGTFTLTLSQVQAVDMYVNVVVSGTATNGTDYTQIPTVVMIPAGQSSVSIDLNPIADGLTESMESVTIATVNPCTGGVSSSANINIRDDIAPSISVVDSTLCLGQSTQLTANGGITYSWTPVTGLSNPNIKNPVATPTATTTYICNMTFGACIKTVSQTVYVSNPANAITASPSGTICNGGTVQLTSVPSNGVSPYSYLWGNGGTTPNITAVTGGTYNVTATDAYGCSASATTSITISNLTITGTATNVSCIGGTNGAIDITVTGANAPYTYNWAGGIVSQDRNNLLAGTYTVTANNTIGCSVTASFTITQPISNLTSTATNVQVTCNGGNNGSINLTPNGGVTPYTFTWSNADTTEDINNLVANSYSVTITDLNGCTTSRTVNIIQPAALVVSFTSVNPNCNGATTGSINSTITGGTSPYTYIWNDGNILQNRTLLSAGTYIITVTDNKGCTVSGSRNITQPSAITITPTVTNASCAAGNDGSITIAVTGGAGSYTYNWVGGIIAQNRNSLIAGTYTVTVTDVSGCTASLPIAVSQIGTGIALTAAVTNVSCNAGSNGAIDITVAGGTLPINYNWIGGITTQDRIGLSAGNYSVTVTDGSGCSAISSSNVTEPTTITVTKVSVNVLCNGSSTGSITLTVSGGVNPYTYTWGGGITSQNRTGIAAGTYTVTVYDANLCSATLSTTITQPAAVLSALVGNTPVSCFGGNNGAVSLTASGGTTPYTYNWSNGIFIQNLNNVIAGTYNVTVTDAHSCTVTATSLVAQPATPVTAVLTAANILCNGTNTGSITNNVSGGTGAYTYNWGGGITTQNRTGLTTGTYTVTVNDATPCSASFSATITQPAVLTVTNTNTNLTCNGGNTGAINLTVTGGTAAYTYNWGGGITTPNRTGLTGGTYTVTVTDANSCSSVNSITVYQPNAISITTSVTNPNCNGQATGGINLSVTGGTGAYSYNWGGGITAQNRTLLSAGTYSVTVTDANSCIGTASSVITQPSLLVTTLTAANVSCTGGNNGNISTTTTGGTSPFSYTWNDGDVNENRYTLNAATYSVTVLDLNNCSTTASIAVTQPATSVSIAVNNISNINCNSDSTGAINITPTGGVPAYTYAWSDGSTLQNRTNMQGGSYHVSVSDANGCQAAATATINQPAQVLSIDTLVTTNILCYGANTGSVNTIVSGGTSPYIYNWGGGIATPNRINLVAGTYPVTVTDNKGCTASSNAVITQPTSALSATTIVNNPNCSGGNTGAMDLSVLGGVTPYTFNWGGGITTEDRTNLATGTYTVVVTDSNNCTVSKTAIVAQPNILSVIVSSATNVLCFGGNNGTITTNVTGGTAAYTYNWGGGITTPNRIGLSAGTYTVTVIDAGLCSATTSAIITQPAYALSIAVASATNVTCYGGNNGTINTSATGGTIPYLYNWGGGNNTPNRTGLTNGNYLVLITDANGCSASASATITQPTSALNVIVSSTTNILCFGGNAGTINTMATGGTPSYTYNWGGGIITPNRTGLTAGTYSVTVTDANACSTSLSATITQPASALTAAVSSATNVLCFGGNNGAITTTVSGGTTGYVYNWDGGITTPNRTGLSAGTYNLTVTDANSCSATASAVINQPASALVIAVTSATNVTCFGGNNGAINTSATGGTTAYSYNWGGGITTVNRTGLSAGTYNVTVADANSCSATTTATITQPVAMQVAVAKADPLCMGGSNGSINTTVTGGVPPMDYLWNTGGTVEDPQGLTAGTYSVVVTDNNGCTTTGAAVLAVTNPLTLTEHHTNVTCYSLTNANIFTQVSGGLPPYHFNWNTGASSRNLMGVGDGSYSVAVTDSNGCVANINAITVIEPSLLAIGIASTDIACAGVSTGNVNVTMTGGSSPYQYYWNNNSANEDLTNVSAGTYSMTVTDVNGCTGIAIASINTLPQLNVSAAVDQLACTNSKGGINLTVNSGTAPYTYLWSTGATTEDLSNIHPGTYTVVVRDANNCPFDTAFTVTNLGTFSINATGGGTITLGQTADLHVTTTGSAQTVFNWTPTFGMDCSTCTDVTVQPGHSTLYTVIGIDTNGCEAIDTVSVTVIEDHTVYTPNAFSPNGDGNNDVLQLYGNLAGIKKFNIMIFDRWGEKVFEANEPTFTWNGIYKGELLEPTVCVYVMRAVFLDGHNEKVFKGSITILR